MGSPQPEHEPEQVVIVPQADIVDFILAKMASANSSRRMIADAAGINRSRVHRILHADCAKRYPIRLAETISILGALGVGPFEAALANELMNSTTIAPNNDMARVIALISVVLEGLPTQIATMVELIDGLEYDDIRRDHGKRVQSAIVMMLKDLYTDLARRRDFRIDHTQYLGGARHRSSTDLQAV